MILKRLREKWKTAREDLAAGGVLALVIGLVSELAGVNIAPTEVDAVVTGLAALAALYARWKAREQGTS